MRLHHAQFVIFGDETCVPISIAFVLPICGTSEVFVWIIDLYKLAPTRYVSVETNHIANLSLYMPFFYLIHFVIVIERGPLKAWDPI
jgi:hypothetical protein